MFHRALRTDPKKLFFFCHWGPHKSYPLMWLGVSFRFTPSRKAWQEGAVAGSLTFHEVPAGDWLNCIGFFSFAWMAKEADVLAHSGRHFNTNIYLSPNHSVKGILQLWALKSFKPEATQGEKEEGRAGSFLSSAQRLTTPTHFKSSGPFFREMCLPTVSAILSPWIDTRGMATLLPIACGRIVGLQQVFLFLATFQCSYLSHDGKDRSHRSQLPCGDSTLPLNKPQPLWW